MSSAGPAATFNGWALLMICGGICAIPQFGVIGLFAAAGAIYGGSCFMRGYMSAPANRKRK